MEKREAGQYLYEMLIKFDASDEDYKYLNIGCKDLAGNESAADDITYLGGASEKFIIDCTKPAIDVRYKYSDASGNITDAGPSASRLYSDKSVTAYLSVSDNWLDEIGDGVHFELTELNGRSVSVQNIVHDEGTDSWSGEINITSDGVYRLHFKVYDEAGNSNEINLAEMVIDKKAPDVSITRDNTSWTNNSEDFSAPEFKNAVGSGYGTVEPGGNGTFAIDRAGSSDFDGYCHIWAYDNAGNLSTVRTTRVRVDKTLPSVTISAEDVNKILNTDYMVTITADDGISNGVRSGLSYISYVVTADGTRTQEGSVALEGESSYSIQVNIYAHANENSEITITASVGDLAGNTNNAETISARTDVTKPEIRVSYDNNSVLNEKYFSSDRTAIITIIDKNFDENLVEITTEGRMNGWTHSGDIHTSSVIYDTDGDYEFDIKCTDLAGNNSSLPDYGDSVNPTSFTIDKTMPVLTITYDNNDVENGNYYKEARTATIHITEHNFDPAAAGIEISPAVGAWTSDGDEHFAVISFTEDAIHTLDVSYTDLAGNKIAEPVHEEFVIDKVAPVITVSDIINRKAYNLDVIAPVISVTDDNFDASRVEIRLVGGNQGDVTAKYLTSSLTATSGYYKLQ